MCRAGSCRTQHSEPLCVPQLGHLRHCSTAVGPVPPLLRGRASCSTPFRLFRGHSSAAQKLLPCCSSTVPPLLHHCSITTAPPLLQHCSSTTVPLFLLCSSPAPLLFHGCCSCSSAAAKPALVLLPLQCFSSVTLQGLLGTLSHCGDSWDYGALSHSRVL